MTDTQDQTQSRMNLLCEGHWLSSDFVLTPFSVFRPTNPETHFSERELIAVKKLVISSNKIHGESWRTYLYHRDRGHLWAVALLGSLAKLQSPIDLMFHCQLHIFHVRNYQSWSSTQNKSLVYT